MSKFSVGEMVDNAADEHESGTVVGVFPTIHDNFRHAVDMEGYGALQFFAEEKLVVTPARRGMGMIKASGDCRDDLET